MSSLLKKSARTLDQLFLDLRKKEFCDGKKDRQTDGHGNSMTNPAQRAESLNFFLLKIFVEEEKQEPSGSSHGLDD